MAIKEQDKVFYKELANGDKVINLPVTRANNVEGLGRSASTAYVVGDVVYVDNNKKVALKCTQAGTTSNDELDVSTVSVGESVTDGSVVWEIVSRDVVNIIDAQRPIKTYTSLKQLGLDNNATIEQICETMPSNSSLLLNMIASVYPNITPPWSGVDGQLVITCNEAARTTMSFTITSGVLHPVYTASYANCANPKFSGWDKVAYNGALSMPSSNKISISVSSGNADTGYDAPADGYITVVATGSASNGSSYISLLVHPGVISGIFDTPDGSTRIRGFIPVAKGQHVQIHSGNILSIDEAYFCYAQSEV